MLKRMKGIFARKFYREEVTEVQKLKLIYQFFTLEQL